MRLLSNDKVVSIIERTLNHVDARLIDHGKRVAYLVYRVLRPLHPFDDVRMRDIAMLAMLHDIGAYKTDEIDKMVIFETIDVWEHSIYGSLFLKYFSPLKDLAPIILFHHADCMELQQLDNPEHQLLAQLISLCDRADVFSLYGGDSAGFRKHADESRNIRYRDDVVDLFVASGIAIETVFDEMDSDTKFHDLFRNTPLTVDAVDGYIKMMIYSIDFRSHQTVIHTASTVCISKILAMLMGADAHDLEQIETGAMLHDIGKIGIPIQILESTHRLSDTEMEIMRSHVDITEAILNGNVSDDIKRVAVNHHEKLDGSGYPRRLKSDALTYLEKIVAIADIFSALCGARSYKSAYPKEKVIGILRDMRAQNLLDPEIVELSMQHFDRIAASIANETQPVQQAYNDMNEEYRQIRDDLENNIFVHTRR